MTDSNRPYFPYMKTRLENVKKMLIENAYGLNEDQLQLYCDDVALLVLKIRSGRIRKRVNRTRQGSGGSRNG